MAESSVRTHDSENPFPGLRPYEPEDSRWFFGREVHTQELLRKLRRHRFLAVVGTSGSGKSSLVRAGLIAALRTGGMRGSGSRWRMAILRPGGDPVGELASALAACNRLSETDDSGNDYDITLQTTLIETTLRRSALGLAEAVRQARLAEGQNLLVVIDQFEEIFRFKRETEDRHASEDAAAFVKLLIEASRSINVPVYVVLTMRSDYLGDCAEFRDLPETINDAQYLIPRLTRDQRREIITAPIAAKGVTIKPRLVQRLLNDIGDNPDQLPILQHALMRTWDKWSAAGASDEPLDIKQYDDIGRTSAALSQHADEIYFNALANDRERQIAASLFKAITDEGQDGRGVRRATRLDKLCEVANADIGELKSVIEAFRQPGCSFLMPPVGTHPDLQPDTVIDISHESLMRIWERLRVWVDEETASARTYKRLAETAVLHKENKAGLWGDPDLSQALAWRENEQPNPAWAQRYHSEFSTAMEFLDNSDQAARQARTKRRNQIIGIVLSAVAIGFFLLWAQAQFSLNQVKVFVDADRVDRLKNACSMLFSLQPLRDGQLESEARQRCEEALDVIPELVAGIDIEAHKKTRDDLEEQGGLQYETARSLIIKLEFFQRSKAFSGNNTEMLKNAFDRWDEVLQAIAKDPRYQDLTLVPQAGLVPIGEDPDSRLWEFAHVLGGKIPIRGDDGKLAFNDDSAVVLVLIPGGTFQMGSETGDSDEEPVHTVTVSQFFMSKYELTQEQWYRLTGERPSDFTGELRPVETVSFNDAAVLSQLGLRLPTEAEWEYAARAGTETNYWWSDELEQNRANCFDCGSQLVGGTTPVGLFPANPFGLHDTAGNVWEWVQDWSGPYGSDAVVDPKGPAEGVFRVLRGGSWSTLAGSRVPLSATAPRPTSGTTLLASVLPEVKYKQGSKKGKGQDQLKRPERTVA